MKNKSKTKLVIKISVTCLIGFIIMALLLMLAAKISDNIKANDDILSKYDTYVIGETISRNTETNSTIDNKGKIHKNTIWNYTFEYEYDNKTYELNKTFVDNTGFLKDFNNEVALKIKSSDPEKAIIAKEYSNTMELIKLIAITILMVIESITIANLIDNSIQSFKTDDICPCVFS